MVAISEPAQRRYAVGFDIGGTKIAAGVVTADGGVVETMPSIPTPASSETLIRTLRDIVVALQQRHPDVEAVGAGAAGLIEWPQGHIRYAPNNSYHDLPMRRLLEDATSLPVVVDNDANVAAWAEARLGRPADYMMFLTVGTGVGGGLVLGGQLYRGAVGIGAEVGHLIVDPDGPSVCGCGNVGCLESVASGKALGRYGREAAFADPQGVLARLAGHPADVDGEIVFQAAKAGDLAAIALYAKIGRWLGIGIASLVNVLDLQLIAVGGSVALADELLLAPVRVALRQYLFARDRREPPVIAPASLGVEAGWIGAGLLALDQHRSPALALVQQARGPNG